MSAALANPHAGAEPQPSGPLATLQLSEIDAQTLFDCLQSEQHELKQLNEQLLHKQTCLIRNDLEALQRIDSSLRQHRNRLLKRCRERSSWAQATVANHRPQASAVAPHELPLKLAQLVECCPKPWKNRLHNAAQALRHDLTQFDSLNQSTNALLEESLKWTKSSIERIWQLAENSEAGLNEPATYSAQDGSLQSPVARLGATPALNPKAETKPKPPSEAPTQLSQTYRA